MWPRCPGVVLKTPERVVYAIRKVKVSVRVLGVGKINLSPFVNMPGQNLSMLKFKSSDPQ